MKIFQGLLVIIALCSVDCRDFPNRFKDRETAAGEPESNKLFEHEQRENSLPIQEPIAENDYAADRNFNSKQTLDIIHPRGSKCKANRICINNGGSCISNVTECEGKLLSKGCKGKKCQCCIHDTMETLIKKLEKNLHDMHVNLTNANTKLSMELQYTRNNLTDANSELKVELQSTIMNLTDALSKCIDPISTEPPTTQSSTTQLTTTQPSTTQLTTTQPSTTQLTTTQPSTTPSVPSGFEWFNGRLIRRTLISDTKVYYDDAMNFCDKFGAKPFIPRTKVDYKLYKDVRDSFSLSDYMWLPADDRKQEGTLRWYNGDAASIPPYFWRINRTLIGNSESADCVFYGCCSTVDGVYGADVYLKTCNKGHRALPPLCERIMK